MGRRHVSDDMAPVTAPMTLAVLPLLERVVLEQMSRLQGKDIQLEIAVSPALRVDLPPGVLHILLSNLVGNAFSHCEPGPVRVAADVSGLQLQNRSKALPAGLSERLGQPFQKGAASAGLGLGLAIVHRLAEHQGLAVVAGQADGNTRVQLRWAAKAWLAMAALDGRALHQHRSRRRRGSSAGVGFTRAGFTPPSLALRRRRVQVRCHQSRSHAFSTASER
jgi:hypothetical protein